MFSEIFRKLSRKIFPTFFASLSISKLDAEKIRKLLEIQLTLTTVLALHHMRKNTSGCPLGACSFFAPTPLCLVLPQMTTSIFNN